MIIIPEQWRAHFQSAAAAISVLALSGCLGVPSATFSAWCPSGATCGISYSQSSYAYPVNSLVNISGPTSSGAPPTSYSISPPLAGTLSFNTSTGAITGSMGTLASPATSYSIVANNSQGSASTTLLLAVTAGPPAKLAWSVFPATPPLVNQCVPVQIEVQDTYGNPAFASGTSLSVNLASSGGGSGAYYADSACTSASSTATIGAGSSMTPLIYFKDTVSETATLTASSGVLASAAQSLISQLRLAITSYNGGGLTIPAGTCVPLTVTAEDINGSAQTVPTTSAFTLVARHSTLYSDALCSTAAGSFPSAQSSTTFYTNDTRVETFRPSISSAATYTTNGPLASTVTITAGPPAALVITGPTFVVPGSCGGPFTVYSLDSNQNISPVATSTLVNLTKTGTSQVFSDATCASVATNITIAANSATQSFFAQDSVSEISTLSASATGLTSGSSFNLDSTATSPLQQIAVAGNFACALIGGAVECWGNDHSGQLGSGTALAPSFIPVTVPGLSTVASIAVGGHPSDSGNLVSGFACALEINSTVWCWGADGNGQLGDGGGTNKAATEVMSGGSALLASQISAGADAACAVTPGGALYCWGNNDSEGLLGAGVMTGIQTPQQVLSAGVAAVNVGDQTVCATLNTGDLECWGLNSFGQIGDGTTTSEDTPTQASGLTSGITAVANAYDSTCAIDASGAVLCWGSGAHGALGNGSTSSTLTPAASLITSGASSLVGGTSDFCALMGGGSLLCWGDDLYGDLGNNSSVSTGTPFRTISAGVTSVSSSGGGNTMCAIVSGNLQCWGHGDYGQLGTGNTQDMLVPTYPGSLE